MRVLFVISDLGFHGAQNQVFELSRELARAGHEVAIYTLNADAPRAEQLVGTGVEVIMDQKRRKLDPAVLKRLRAKIRGWKADIVHGFLFDGDIYARLAAVGTGAVVFNSERSDAYKISNTQKAAHWLTKPLVDAVVANTRSGSAFAQKLYGYRPAQMHVVMNGLRIDDIERKAAAAHDYRSEFFGAEPVKILCMVGHIKPAKDHPLAMEVAAELIRRDPSWRALFLGDSLTHTAYQPGVDSDTTAWKNRVMAHYERLGLADKIRFPGSRKDACAILAQCDVQLMTSTHEGFPNVVLEGMVLGVPVVSTAYSDIRHILPRPQQQVVAERDPVALADAVEAAYDDRAAIAAEQKRWARTHATIENVTRELESVYAKYLRPRARVQAA